MSKNRDPLALSANWHIDCRIEAELPEDNIIGKRFLVHVIFTGVMFSALLYTGWLGFVTLSLRHQIRDWEQRINDNRGEVREIQRMQKEYTVEAIKIDQAHALVKPQLFVADFIANIGRTRPEMMAIDLIEWNDVGIVIRGSLQERSERAAQTIGGYIETLRKDQKIGPLFRDINVADIDRGTTGDMLKFEIVFKLKGSG